MKYDKQTGIKRAESLKLLPPHLRSLAAVRADINILTAFQHFFSKIDVGIIVPDLFERLPFKITKAVLCIFIKATRNHKPVPADHRCVP